MRFLMFLTLLFAEAVILVISWLLTCGIVYVLFCCFGLTFSWPIGTGIWSIWLILKSIISERKGK